MKRVLRHNYSRECFSTFKIENLIQGFYSAGMPLHLKWHICHASHFRITVAGSKEYAKSSKRAWMKCIYARKRFFFFLKNSDGQNVFIFIPRYIVIRIVYYNTYSAPTDSQIHRTPGHATVIFLRRRVSWRSFATWRSPLRIGIAASVSPTGIIVIDTIIPNTRFPCIDSRKPPRVQMVSATAIVSGKKKNKKSTNHYLENRVRSSYRLADPAIRNDFQLE